MRLHRPARHTDTYTSSRALPRRARRAAGIAAAAALAAGPALIAGPQAHADGGVGIAAGIAIQSAGGTLEEDTVSGSVANLGLAMASGTSPSTTFLVQGGNLIVFQSSTNQLWITDGSTSSPVGFGMMPGTSPVITSLFAGGYEIAFQDNNGLLVTTGTAGTTHWNLAMDTKSSPGITAEPNGGYEVAYHSLAGTLGVAGTWSTTDLGLPMYPGTNPSIITPANGGYGIAYSNANSVLDGAGTINAAAEALLPGSSPSATLVSITPVTPAGSTEIAYVDRRNLVEVWGSVDILNLNRPVQPGTNPSIIGIPTPAALGAATNPGFEVAYQVGSFVSPTEASLWTIQGTFQSANTIISPVLSNGNPVYMQGSPSVGAFVPVIRQR